MIKGFLGLPWLLWAALALIIAVTYAFVWPRKTATGMSGIRFFIIRWGHTLTWVLLTVNFVLRGIDPALNGAANIIALIGGLMYVLFMFMTFVVK